MANTLTSLAQTLYRAYNEVPMEATGFLDSLGANWNAEAVGINATVKVPVITPRAIESVPTPAMTWSAGTDSVTSTRDFTLTGVAQYSFNMTAEEEKYLSIPDNVTAMEMLRLNLEQGKRVIRNTIEAAVGAALNVNASRAIGSAGTAPFGSDITMLNEAIRQLQLNGAADSGRVGILNFNAGYNLRSIAQLQKINESAGDMIRSGIIGRLAGTELYESANIATQTKGAGTGALINKSGGLAIGATTIPFDTMTVNTTGIKAGDVITVAGDTVNKYVVKTGSTAASGDLVIQEPGLLAALDDGAAITVTASHVANIVAAPWSTKIIARPLAQPQSPAVEQLVLSDAKGWSCNLIRVVGDQMASWYMRVAYGAFVPNPFGVIKIMG
jgi:hypothetical protein